MTEGTLPKRQTKTPPPKNQDNKATLEWLAQLKEGATKMGKKTGQTIPETPISKDPEGAFKINMNTPDFGKHPPIQTRTHKKLPEIEIPGMPGLLTSLPGTIKQEPQIKLLNSSFLIMI